MTYSFSRISVCSEHVVDGHVEAVRDVVELLPRGHGVQDAEALREREEGAHRAALALPVGAAGHGRRHREHARAAPPVVEQPAYEVYELRKRRHLALALHEHHVRGEGGHVAVHALLPVAAPVQLGHVHHAHRAVEHLQHGARGVARAQVEGRHDHGCARAIAESTLKIGTNCAKLAKMDSAVGLPRQLAFASSKFATAPSSVI
ncbi:PP37 [Orf virus]|uniref:PP37 n=1 Tax=Orf virus TaxID=10258 RepID=F1AXC8_ORFV|nr:PP37 [Orf virus]